MERKKKENSTAVEETITRSQRIREEEETRKKAMRLGMSYVNIVGFPINSDTISMIPEEKARMYNAVPYLEIADTVRVATTDPQNEDLIEYLEILKKDYKKSFKSVFASKTSLNFGLGLYKKTKKTVGRKVEEITISKEKVAEEIKNIEHLKEKLKNASTTELLDILLAGAVGLRSSDIHVVPSRDKIRVRFRIDGVLHDAAVISQDQYKKLDSRIKFLSHMKMGEEHLPQDGRFTSKIAGRDVDLRVSTLPTLHGDSIVARILEEKQKEISLEELGFNESALKAIQEAMKKPNGMILNTGPTGSGKTTTLYALINKLNKPEVKIVTLEDPVEYQIEGIDQTQIDTRHDLNFAKGLRAALRQDPDIIMVGEIRDFETASIALHASLTGHLLLTTLHTNNAPAAFVRLLDMRIRPFLLVGSINLAIAQRLVRLICPDCKEEHKLKKNEKLIIENYFRKNNIKKTPPIYQGKGCPVCNGTGYSGRTAIIEFIKPDEEIEKLIMEEATQNEIEKAAIKGGMKTMLEDGLDKVVAGQTTIEEVLRVTTIED